MNESNIRGFIFGKQHVVGCVGALDAVTLHVPTQTCVPTYILCL